MMKTSIQVFAFLLLPVIVSGQLAWTDHVIDGIEGDPYNGGYPHLQAADLDGDGDMDVIAYPSYDGFLGRWLNVDGQGRTWEELILAPHYNVADIGDINGDGNLDMVGANYSFDQLYWKENIGSPAEEIVHHVIFTLFEGVPTVNIADIDGDGDLDIVTGNDMGAGWVFWWENLDGDGLNWQQSLIANPIESIEKVNTADLDGDGDMDVLGAAYYPGQFVWWSNDDGVGETWTQHSLSSEYGGNTDIDTADLDGDGDLDILGVSYYENEVFYWTQEEDGSWSENPLGLDQVGIHLGPKTVDTGDFDNDGDIDIVTGLLFENLVLIWENVAGDASLWLPHQVGGTYEGVWPVGFADMNGDGALDIMAGTHDAGQMKWWEQSTDRTVTVTPIVSIIPPEGGTLEYSLHLLNDTPFVLQGLNFWTEVLQPDGQYFGPLVTTTFTLPENVDITVPMEQNVPFFAPGGTYVFIAHVGYMNGWIGNPNSTFLTDTFIFTKEPEQTSSGVSDWNGTEAIQIESASDNLNVTIPSEFSLSTAYPNPFNPSTSLNISLPEAVELNVVVYNIAGQQVAILADSPYGIGLYTLTFDASHMASGVYFVRVTTSSWSAMQKVMLVR